MTRRPATSALSAVRPIAADPASAPDRVVGRHHAGAPRPAGGSDDACPWCGSPSRGPVLRPVRLPGPRSLHPPGWFRGRPGSGAGPEPEPSPAPGPGPEPGFWPEPEPATEHEPSVSASSSLTSWSAVPAAPPGPVTRLPSGPPESLFPAISPPDPPASPWDRPRLHSSPAGLSAAAPTAPRAAPADPASPVRPGPGPPRPGAAAPGRPARRARVPGLVQHTGARCRGAACRA